jgi:hypothetical protein
LSHTCNSVCSGYFLRSFFFFFLHWLASQSSIYASLHSWNDRCMLPHPVFSVEKWTHEHFFPSWPGTMIL